MYQLWVVVVEIENVPTFKTYMIEAPTQLHARSIAVQQAELECNATARVLADMQLAPGTEIHRKHGQLSMYLCGFTVADSMDRD